MYTPTKTGARVAFRFIIITLVASVFTAVHAVQPTNGFFTGVNLDPLGSSSISTVETEPAVVLMFASDQKTADITRQFEEWFTSSARADVSVYAIAVAPDDLSREIVAEAIQQRNLTMPVYLSRVDMLLGDDFRLLVLNNDAEVQRFTTLDFAGVNTSLQTLGISVSGAPAVSSTPTSTSTPEPTIDPNLGPATITTTTTTQSRIAGDVPEESLYVNDTYGFQVEFPPGWRYKIAAQNDGAVAAERPGSRMDMRVWTVPAEDSSTPQAYIDERLEGLARKSSTRVNVERRFVVRDGEQEGVDVTYVYTRPIDSARPAMGVLLYRGRLQVIVNGGQVIAAGVEAPAGEFAVLMSVIEPFFRSFKVNGSDNVSPAQYKSPTI